jgi:hypothetical protein
VFLNCEFKGPLVALKSRTLAIVVTWVVKYLFDYKFVQKHFVRQTFFPKIHFVRNGDRLLPTLELRFKLTHGSHGLVKLVKKNLLLLV